ncbi:MAG: Dam family site-specific DNA-(adenine-N6)-methyltransferase [Methanobrevibacter thaueri]|nr:Dam family site-specific DNA-(adenine-N6)-methyltransferase [Methanobrevibacter thaueri]
MQSRLIQGQNFYAKPFLKWVGGKGQLLKEIDQRLPKIVKDDELECYFEPFVGAGSVFFHLKNNYKISKSIISDINPELILTYKAIQKDYKKVIKELKPLKKEYNDYKTAEERKNCYLEKRKLFNENLKEINYDEVGELEFRRAAQMIFINKTCFNGMFRVNKEGKFNVPAGRYENPSIYKEDNLYEVHKVLNDNVIIKTQDFLEIEPYVTNKSFIYLDPPYRPLNQTSNFTQYYKDNFGDLDQIRLSEFIQRLSKKHIPMLLSNSNSKNEDNKSYFKKLYKNQKIEYVKARRNINANAKKRKAIDELIIKNY